MESLKKEKSLLFEKYLSGCSFATERSKPAQVFVSARPAKDKTENATLNVLNIAPANDTNKEKADLQKKKNGHFPFDVFSICTQRKTHKGSKLRLQLQMNKQQFKLPKCKSSLTSPQMSPKAKAFALPIGGLNSQNNTLMSPDYSKTSIILKEMTKLKADCARILKEEQSTKQQTELGYFPTIVIPSSSTLLPPQKKKSIRIPSAGEDNPKWPEKNTKALEKTLNYSGSFEDCDDYPKAVIYENSIPQLIKESQNRAKAKRAEEGFEESTTIERNSRGNSYNLAFQPKKGVAFLWYRNLHNSEEISAQCKRTLGQYTRKETQALVVVSPPKKKPVNISKMCSNPIQSPRNIDASARLNHKYQPDSSKKIIVKKATIPMLNFPKVFTRPPSKENEASSQAGHFSEEDEKCIPSESIPILALPNSSLKKKANNLLYNKIILDKTNAHRTDSKLSNYPINLVLPHGKANPLLPTHNRVLSEECGESDSLFNVTFGPSNWKEKQTVIAKASR